MFPENATYRKQLLLRSFDMVTTVRNRESVKDEVQIWDAYVLRDKLNVIRTVTMHQT